MNNKTPSRKRLYVTPSKPKSAFADTIKSCTPSRNVETPKKSHKANFKFDKLKDCNKEINNTSKITVAVRVRPLSLKEKISESPCAVSASGNELFVKSCVSKDIGTENRTVFSYDHVFWYENADYSASGEQQIVFEKLALPLLNASLEGYNVCLFAYGQTGSGKTYSMMDADGSFCDQGIGIIPRFSKELLNRKSYSIDTYSITISYYEIYNEKIYDLLRVESECENKVSLKVREHPHTGPYVADLTTLSVESFDTVMSLLTLGNSRRITGATLKNERSSRSHTIFEIVLSQRSEELSITSKISLVDLAGSERVSLSINEERFKEGLSINKSLLTLGKVISALADIKKAAFVPYRDSLLTWLLKDSLGGNSHTTMLATVSPSVLSLEETLATLRYANKAQHIMCVVSRNEDPQIRLIKDLQNEVHRLKSLRDNIESRSSIATCVTESKLSAADLEQKQKALEAQLQKELARLEMHLELAEKRKAELESQRAMILHNVRESAIPSYKTNFYDNLKSLLNTSLNDSISSDISDNIPLSSSKLEKQKCISKIKYFLNCLNTSYKKDLVCESNDNIDKTSQALMLTDSIRRYVCKLSELSDL